MLGVGARTVGRKAQEQACDWIGERSPRTGVSLGGAIGEIFEVQLIHPGYKALHPSPAMLQHRATTQGFSSSVVKDLQKGELGSLDKLKLNNIACKDSIDRGAGASWRKWA